MTKQLPPSFSRYARKDRDLSEARLDALAALALARGLDGKTDVELWRGLALAFAEAQPGWWYAPYRRGRKPLLPDPIRLYGIVNAILCVAHGHENPLPAEDAKLRQLVGRIGRELGKKVDARTVCRKLVETEDSPWHSPRRSDTDRTRAREAEHLREIYQAEKSRQEAIRAKLRANLAWLNDLDQSG